MAADKYLWKRDAKELTCSLLERVKKQDLSPAWRSVERDAVTAFNAYYGRYFQEGVQTSIGSAGEQGELLTLASNHYASLLRSIMNLTTQERITFDVDTENNDIESRDVAMISESILNAYFYERNFNLSLL